MFNYTLLGEFSWIKLTFAKTGIWNSKVKLRAIGNTSRNRGVASRRSSVQIYGVFLSFLWRITVVGNSEPIHRTNCLVELNDCSVGGFTLRHHAVLRSSIESIDPAALSQRVRSTDFYLFNNGILRSSVRQLNLFFGDIIKIISFY